MIKLAADPKRAINVPARLFAQADFKSGRSSTKRVIVLKCTAKSMRGSVASVRMMSKDKLDRSVSKSPRMTW